MFNHNPNHYIKQVFDASKVSKAMIMVHSRGGSAKDILSVSNYITRGDEFIFLAPQADGSTWYPNSFLLPITVNEPGLSNGLSSIDHLVLLAKESHHLQDKDIYFMGFSQGACLMLEYAAGHAKRYGGVFAFSGALQGPVSRDYDFTGHFEQTPVFLGCSDTDPHIPLQKVNDAAVVFSSLQARVVKTIYPNAPHTILQQEITTMNEMIG